MSTILDAAPGSLTEPMTGRHWDQSAVLDRYLRRAAFYGRLCLEPGDRVFFHYGNTPEFFVDLLAVWNLGGCAVPIDSRLTPFEIETLARAALPRLSLWSGTLEPETARRLSGLGARVVDASEADLERSRERTAFGLPKRLDEDALILFTSGTTGQPKGVVHTHRSLRARWTALRRSLGLESFRRTLCLLPTHFGHGLICNSLFPWLYGQHLFIVPPFKPDLLLGLGALIDAHEITFLSSVPTVWRLALKTSAPPRSRRLERVFCGSAPLSAHLWSDIGRWTGARDVWNAYGITETGSWLAGTSLEDFTPEDGLVGVPWGGEIRIIRAAEGPDGEACESGESGHVWVRTPALMRGYLGRDDLTAEVVSAGWFRTGDVGFVDERGRLYL